MGIAEVGHVDGFFHPRGLGRRRGERRLAERMLARPEVATGSSPEATARDTVVEQDYL